MNKQELYSALVNLCQQFGSTTEATYNLLHEAIESIYGDDDEGS